VSNLGLGVMLSQLGGESMRPLAKFLGQRIDSASVDDKHLKLRFGDRLVTLWDNGQSCCESRYMTTDDDVSQMIGEMLRDAEIADGPSEGDQDSEVHEQQFLRIATDKQTYTFVTHNEHNGYYGGFSVVATEGAVP
jgi:hypothetical protein